MKSIYKKKMPKPKAQASSICIQIKSDIQDANKVYHKDLKITI